MSGGTRRSETEEIILGFIEKHNEKGEYFVPIRVDLIDICGGYMPAGIMLSSIIYFNDKGTKGNIYKSARKWYEETRLTDWEVKQGSKTLDELDLVHVENHSVYGHNTRWYKLNIDNVINKLAELYEKRKNEKQEYENELAIFVESM